MFPRLGRSLLVAFGWFRSPTGGTPYVMRFQWLLVDSALRNNPWVGSRPLHLSVMSDSPETSFTEIRRPQWRIGPCRISGEHYATYVTVFRSRAEDSLYSWRST
jgi:hypothetical protein